MLLRSVRALHTSPRALANYGFVGLGQMGQHMARHIYEKLEPADRLVVNDSSEAAADAFVTASTAANPLNAPQLSKGSLAELAAADLDFVITMVPEGRHVEAVVTEFLHHYQPRDRPIYLLDSSTIDIETSRRVHELAAQTPQVDFIDAPVSGGVAGARNATLSFMLSRATAASIPSPLVTLLNKMGRNIFPCGQAHGSGLAAKLSNNYLLAVTNLAVADSFQLARSFGLNVQAYAQLVAVSTGKSWASVDNCPIAGAYPPEKQLPADNGFKGGFTTKLTRKDLVLATQCAAQNNRSLYLGDVSRFWYDKACEHDDLANRDLGVLYEWLGDIDTTELKKE
ncbi:3-hydroxyisobutyrate dehydrogenase [[Candida] zeylanoides]